MDRRQRVLNHVSPRGRTGIEIGPLNRPIVRLEDGAVLYADHLPVEGLRRKYAGHPALAGGGDLVPVDLVLDGIDLPEALGARGPVDYVVASHVLEHVADPIGWLAEIAQVLRAGGLLCLLVPDKRFTFDHFRTPTAAGELVEAHLRGLRRPPAGHVYEQIARCGPVDPFALWAGRPVAATPYPGGGPEAALRAARAAVETGDYVDAHCSVFTPYGFVAILAELMALDLVSFAFAAFEPTRRNDNEFLALLRTCPGASPEVRARSAPRLDPRLHDAVPPPPGWGANLARRLRRLRRR